VYEIDGGTSDAFMAHAPAAGYERLLLSSDTNNQCRREMSINDEIAELIETIEGIRFLTHSWDGERAEMLANARAAAGVMNREGRLELRAELRHHLKELRDWYGALCPDEKFRELLVEGREHRGYAYLPKRFIDTQVFSRYERVFQRWPHVPSHALVVFDPTTHCPLTSIYQPEVDLWNDSAHMIGRAREFHKNIAEFRKRDPQDQRLLQSYLRSAATAIFQTLEAYLNGVAYDCFTAHHDELELDDHDLLGEWNTANQRRKFVAFERKLHDYPRIAATATGGAIDVSGWGSTGFIMDVGKNLRDAITHPSPFVDPKTKQNEKTFWLVGINIEVVTQLFDAARDYMQRVESALSAEPTKSAPWLFEET